MVPHLLEAGVGKRAIDVYSLKTIEVYKTFDLMAESIPHDVPNCCYRIFDGTSWLFYATDTSTLDHIEAKDYDLYLIEANRTDAEFSAAIAEKQARGEFAYETRAAQNHLSREQALDWLARNAGPNSRYEFLHQHKEATHGLDTP